MRDTIMEQIFYAMPKWYFFLALIASFGGGIFFMIIWALVTGKVEKW